MTTGESTSWFDRLRTFLIVTVVAALVWVFAEGESLRSGERQEVRIRFVAPPDILVAPAEGESTIIRRIRIDGSAHSVGEAVRAIGQEIVLERGRDLPATPGEHTIDLREALQRHPMLAERGVTVRDVEPDTLRIRIVELETVEARVIFPGVNPRDAIQLEARPATVQVTLPKSAARNLTARLEIAADLIVDRSQDLGPDGTAELRDVALIAPEALAGLDGFRITPSSITVQVTRGELRGTRTLPAVAVHFRIPAVSFGKYEVEIDPSDETLDNVVIRGPADLLAQIGPGNPYQPLAVVELSPSELDAAIDQAIRAGTVWATIERPPTLIRVPAGVGDDWDADDRLITLRVRRRVGAADVPPPPGGE